MTSLGVRSYDQAFGVPYQMYRSARAVGPVMLRTRYRTGLTQKRNNPLNMRRFRKNIRRIVNGSKEMHFVDYSWGKSELYHNTYAGTFVGKLNGTAMLPSQGDGDSNRTGNDILARGISCKLMFGCKADRHNTTFRVIVFRTTKGYAISPYTQVFDNQTGNVMLDALDKDRVKVISDKKYSQKVDVNDHNANKEITFFRKLWIPHKALYKFYDDGLNDNSYPYDIHLAIMCYDAYGSLVTDNIAYVQLWSRFYFKDK